jgi:hypothetical protein
MLGAEADRVGLQRQDRAVRADDLVFVDRALADAGQEDFPHPGAAAPPHRVAPPVPGVEVAHDRDAPRVRGPDGEMRALRPLMGHHMRAERVPEPVMRALADEVFVDLAQHRAETVGIVEGSTAGGRSGVAASAVGVSWARA